MRIESALSEQLNELNCPGAIYTEPGNCLFSVWAPFAEQMDVAIQDRQQVSMTRNEKGYWSADIDGLAAGRRYFFVLNKGLKRPDPASYCQPEGVNGPSEIVNHHSFQWTDAGWTGLRQEELVFYELHTGTFTPEGTFEAIIERISELKAMGVTALELMPVAQFPGGRNWGYDGVYPYAVQVSYGGPEGLKRLVNACHAAQMAVVLDVVYNHFGPEGNYLRDFGPYFTAKYNTPWGDAVNFDDRYSDQVRKYFINNALYWLRQYHVDALRLDALHQIYDMSAVHFLKELAEAVKQLSAKDGRTYLLIGESELNNVRLIESPHQGGYGLDALWCDDFHHSLHVLLTGEKTGYYEDFGGTAAMAKSLREGYVYSWMYSRARQKRVGSSSQHIAGRQFVVFSQNHDHIGNRMLGERKATMVSFEALKLEAAVVILSPYLPLLFMGQEYGETAPFLYFVSFEDKDLVQAVREGRRKEFEAFHKMGEAPDPQAVMTFEQSKIDWKRRYGSRLLAFYARLIEMRKTVAALTSLSKEGQDVKTIDENVIVMKRQYGQSCIMCWFHFGKEDFTFEADVPEGRWRLILDSAALEWDGVGGILTAWIEGGRQTLRMPGLSAAVYEQTEGGD